MTVTAYYIRPDRVTRTSVVEPYPVRTTSPVLVARTTIDPFVDGVRAAGMQLSGNGGEGGIALRRQYAIVRRERKLPKAPPGGVPVDAGNLPRWLPNMQAYGRFYRQQAYADTNAAYTTVRAANGKAFAPNVFARTAGLIRVPMSRAVVTANPAMAAMPREASREQTTGKRLLRPFVPRR